MTALPVPPLLGRVAVRARRLLVRHPLVYWVTVVSLATATAFAVKGHVDALDEQRSQWGRPHPVLVAARDIAPGEPLVVERRTVPDALAPHDAVGHDRPTDDAVARQWIAAGEIVTTTDIAPPGLLALAPPGSLVVTIAESPPSGAAIGEHVWLVADGVVVTDAAIVVEAADDLTRVAVPEGAAPAASVAAARGDLVVMRAP